MSDEQEENTKPDRPRTVSGWWRFHEKHVLLQLLRPYGATKVGVDGWLRPANFADVGSCKTDDPQASQQAFAEAIPGMLFVEPNGSGGVVLILKTLAANGDATVALNPEMVAYCTMAERRFVQPA